MEAGGTMEGEKKVRYEVTSASGPVHVTISNDGRHNEKFYNVKTPWEKESVRTEGFVDVAAQSPVGGGEVTVKIFVNGKLVKQAHSYGEQCIATAFDWLSPDADPGPRRGGTD